MRKLNILFAFYALCLCVACQSAQDNTAEEMAQPKIPVEVVKIDSGTVSDNLELSATSIYLQRTMMTAPIPAFITRVNTHLGAQVRQGEVLYELETKEHRALGAGASRIDSTLKDFGIIKVRAASSGVISTFDKQQAGEYVTEGTPLCTIAKSNDLAFQINVPYEYSGIVKPGKNCFITLPDGSRHQAVITTPLTSMNVTSQTQTLLAKLNQSMVLPENLIAKVEISKGTKGKQQILPRSCVLSDEMMKDFWVMKLINDTTAVRVPVTTGNKNAREIEILKPKFNPTDKIIISGNYGLPDTALVSITKEN
nr:HlyD family efflux transporter periplasmic adaptor subunit [uncultured Pedobacter sp.]